MEFSKEVILLILGGGASWIVKDGVAALLKVRQGRAAKEDTALQQWKEIAERHESGEKKAWAIVRSYRRYYSALWVAYYQAKHEGERLSFPSDPSAEVEDAADPEHV